MRLTVTDLSKHYPSPHTPLVVLQGVNLELESGQRLAIVGPSGSGKSTLLNILGALDEPTGGQVRFDQADPFALSPAARARLRGRHVGFVFQDHHLLGQCSAVENVMLAALALGRSSRADLERARELLDRVGLGDRGDHLPAELSGGERQRVAIARALMNKPSLLLCDEPTGNLDAETGQAIGDLFIELADQTQAILIVATHSQSLAERVGRQARLVEGTLRQ